ncbi:2-iminobutanoate/2-iminopropanoate deaminase [Talaromyces atroroseus]|uniref:2-iminobutanoate/2-iminopropanoate deaminase n=1 Tax=Talaromyces atroroseus TaxID=1441469 RepID=A0A1Q5QB29_TALAT|nr:2-iminobutanoate/2-iminopropanoate deaminase [Talaromyces atroroseus]OKL63018.1 2-iminobutanoate/2-iminopropanoate deaminase [Talaromyces atroroseus]
MASKTPILTDKAPKPLPGIYSQAIVANGVVYCSGSIGMDPVTGSLVEGDIKARTHQCIKNLSHVLEAAGSSIEKVVKVNVFIDDMDKFAEMNSVYTQYWGDIKPCRTCVAVKTLPRNTDVEIECTAVLSDASGSSGEKFGKVKSSL